ncbi:MAG: PAS domain S-box protein [Syntrophales bacterium]|jgi:PAS domain S-box-containing protein/putative nucleotidyltransferase with HDIG domain|nr:PAS domain S-box protein [Syntrophales bacterium]
MMDEAPLYNSRILKSYVEYLKRYLPDIDIAPLLNYADIETYQLDDEGHWLTQSQVDRFHTILAKTAQDPDISRKVGRFSVTSRASGALGQYMLGFINPATAYGVLEKINANLSRGAVLKTKAIGADQIEAKAVLQPGVVEKPYQCLNRLGGLEALAKLSTNKFARIEHPVCIHKGGDCCLYIITWEKTRALLWRKIRSYSLVPGFVICFISLGILSPVYWDTLVLLYMVMAMGVTLYTEYLEKKDLLANIHNQGDAADRLLDQINKRYNEALLIQEIGQASSMILEDDKLLIFIMESLEKRLDFDRGMIMLTNKQKDCLVYAVSYGYNPKDEDYLKNIKFHLDNPLSKGMAVEAFRKQKPVLVNDVSDIENDLSPKSLDFVRTMGSQSFICVPIVDKGESMGILTVDNVQSKKPLSQTEMSLLMGIAPQIGISINNALVYQKIKESELRFRSLSENAPDIIYTLGIKGEFTYVNPVIETILGYRPEEIIGKYFVDIARKEDVSRHIKAFKQVRDRKQTLKEETVILIHKDGTERYFSISGAPNFDSEGNFLGLVGTFKNLTDIRRSEMELKKSFEKLQSAMSSTIDAISIIVESRDPYTAGHQRRVAQLAVAIAGELGLSEERIDLIRMGSLIHDVGKIYIPAEILTKPSRLNDIEFAMMKSHPTVGHKILNKVDFIPVIVDMVYQHHERMDGSGYPLGISGDEIFLESRIIAVSDTVEAMASHRPYRPALGVAVALEGIKKLRGSAFDAEVVDACLRLFEEQGFDFK